MKRTHVWLLPLATRCAVKLCASANTSRCRASLIPTAVSAKEWLRSKTSAALQFSLQKPCTQVIRSRIS